MLRSELPCGMITARKCLCRTIVRAIWGSRGLPVLPSAIRTRQCGFAAGRRKELFPWAALYWHGPSSGQAAEEGEQRTRVMDAKDQALLALGKELQSQHYRFTTGTPASHHRVNQRSTSRATPLERVFGWSCPFERIELPPSIVALLEQAGELEADGDRLRAKVRFSSLGGQLFVHSAFPTEAVRHRFLWARHLPLRACAGPFHSRHAGSRFAYHH